MANELILIVEDNEQNRKLARDILAFRGYRIAEATTGEEGVQMAARELPALVLMDIQLPGINGIEALRRLRADDATKGIPVIAFTASVMPQDRSQIMTAGFDAFVSKPISIKEFTDCIAHTLGGGHSRA